MSAERFAPTLFADGPSERRSAWIDFSLRNIDEVSVMHAAGLSGDYVNVLEHSLVVGAGSEFMSMTLAASGVAINVPAAKKGGLLHDAAKKMDHHKGISYATEQELSPLESLMSTAGYPPEIIAIAKHTGRVANLYIEDPASQRAAIAMTAPEQQVVGYTDARTSNTEIVSLETALERNKEKNPDEEEFYDTLWYPYYHNLGVHLFAGAGVRAFRPESLNDEAVDAFVLQAAR